MVLYVKYQKLTNDLEKILSLPSVVETNVIWTLPSSRFKFCNT